MIDQTDDGHGPELVQQQMEWPAFEKHAAQDDQEEHRRGDVLKPQRGTKGTKLLFYRYRIVISPHWPDEESRTDFLENFLHPLRLFGGGLHFHIVLLYSMLRSSFGTSVILR